MSSHERLDMEQQKSMQTTVFKQKKGVFVERWQLGVGAAAVLLGLLLVGLLVGYLAPCRGPCGPSPLSDDHGGGGQAPKQYPYVRLPRSVVPEHYDVELQPFLAPDNFTFRGQVKVLVRAVQGTDNITLNINDIAVDEQSVRLTSAAGGGGVPGLSRISEDKLREFLVLHLDSDLQPDHRYELEMAFTGNLNDQLVGFYRSQYKGVNGEKRWLATTQFQPTDARRAFPCFDEPAFKATFNITIVHWRNMSSMSNMPIYKIEERGENWVADYFQTTVRMSTYLLAFIVSDFESKGTPEFSVWSRAEAINTTAYALDIGPKILRFYEGFFDIKYPLPKTDMVAIPDFNAGAMENWGIITYRETALLYDPDYSSSDNKVRVATVVAHELAHQWFGNLVTPKWWDDLWLNEGFASYVEYLGVNSVHPDWMMDQQFVVDDLQNVMDLDCLRTSHPISVPVGHPDEINEIFDRISYGKGATVIRMMKFFLGDEVFKRGLTNYLEAKKFDNAVQDDLWEYLSAAQTGSDKIDVKAVMDSWTLQTGYPVVTVTRDYEKGTAALHQHRFLLDQSSEPTNVQWEVPISYVHGGNPDWEPTTKLWLHKSNGSVSGLPKDQWVVFNTQQIGYYRVNYDQENWKRILNQLNADHTKIHTINRAQILDDSMDLARAGLITYELALNATRYLKNEKEYVPWHAAISSLMYVDSMLSRTSIYGTWKKYFINQLQPLYDWLGWEETQDEDILKQFLRATVLRILCGYDHKDCVDKAQDLFQKWKEDTSNMKIISPNLRSVVYCTAVRHGGEEKWSFVWQQYLKTQVASEKSKLMYSLACAREPWLLTRYLGWCIKTDSSIRRQDGISVFGSIGSKLYGRDLTFNYLRDKWDGIFELYGKSFFAMSNMVKSITSSMNTQFELDQLKEFYKLKRNNLGATKRAFEQSIEKAEANVQWMRKNYAQIEKWLESVASV